MNNHSLAIAFALVGAGVGGFLSAESGSFMPIILGLLLGCFFGYFVAGLIGVKSSLLQKNFQSLGNIRGKSLDEITKVVGDFTSEKTCRITDRENEKGKLYTWTSDKYEIELLFGGDGLCIGVNKETRL